MKEMIKGKYIYKLCDEEENSYYTYISTDVECGKLIKALVDFYKERYSLLDAEDENYAEQKNTYLLNIKQGLSNIKQLFEDSNDFDHKAEEIVNNLYEDCDYYGGNAEEYVYDILKGVGVNVHYEDIRTFYY